MFAILTGIKMRAALRGGWVDIPVMKLLTRDGFVVFVCITGISTIALYPSFDQQTFLFSSVHRRCALYRFRQVPWALHAPVSARHRTVWRLI